MPQQSKSDSLLDELSRDYKRLKQQKSRKTGGVEGRVLLNIGFVGQDQYLYHKNQAISMQAREDNKLYLTFDMISPRMGKLLGRLSAIAPQFKAQPLKKDPDATSKAEVVDQLIKALDIKLIQPSRTWEILWWMAVGGVAFEHVPWIPNETIEPIPQLDEEGNPLFKNIALPKGPDDQVQSFTEAEMEQIITGGQFPREVFEVWEEPGITGDIGSEVLGPLNVFIDQSVRSIASLAPDQRIHIAKLRTVGWIEENFGKVVEPDKNLQIVTTKFNQLNTLGEGSYLRDLIPLVQGTSGEDDPPSVVVVECYSPPSKKDPSGRYSIYVPGKEMIDSQPNPYGEIPVVDYHWKPTTTTFWGGDYVSSLIAPQRFINKRISQLGEQSNGALYSNLLLGPGLKATDIPADYVGAIENGINDQGTPMVGRTPPAELPVFFMDSIATVIRMFNDIAGGSDLFEEQRFPGQIRGPMAVPLLQEILDTEWGPLYNHIAERMGLAKQMRLNRVKQFYPAVRTLHYTNRDLKDEVLEFHAEEVLRSGTDFKIVIERGEIMPELRALREMRVKERLSGPLAILYMDQRTGQLDKSKIAADLQFGDTGRESREAVYRKLGAEMVQMLWKAEPTPPVLPFYDHAVMMDELEASMATTEFLRASPQIQVSFTQRWEQHRNFLLQEAQAQQTAMMSMQAHQAVAQATQQAAAMASAGAVNEAQNQAQAQKEVPTKGLVSAANQQVQNAKQPPRKAPFGGQKP